MLALIAQLSPLWQIVGTLMEDIDLAISTIGAHDILFDRFLDLHLLDQFVEGRQGVFPFLRWDNLDNSRFHAIGVDFRHLDRC